MDGGKKVPPYAVPYISQRKNLPRSIALATRDGTVVEPTEEEMAEYEKAKAAAEAM